MIKKRPRKRNYEKNLKAMNHALRGDFSQITYYFNKHIVVSKINAEMFKSEKGMSIPPSTALKRLKEFSNDIKANFFQVTN